MKRPNVFGPSLKKLATAWSRAQDEQARADQEMERAFQSTVDPYLREVSSLIAAGRWHPVGWNVFDVLGRTWREDAYSDALAWLFNPREAHGMGIIPLEAFLQEACGQRTPNQDVIEVKARKRLTEDATIDVQVQGRGWWLGVENKANSLERDGQTIKYEAFYERFREAGDKVFLVFLTIDGVRAQSDKFRSMTYRRLRRVLEALEPETEAARIIIEHFVQHILSDLEVSL